MIKMITDRDNEMIEWLCEFRIATSSQINQLFYKNMSICNKRLLKLHKDKIIGRSKDPYSKQYFYYIKKPKSILQLKHYYIRNEFYIKLVEIGCLIKKSRVECKMGSIIPDLYVELIFNEVEYKFFVEVERSEQKINVKKYNKFFIDDFEEYIEEEIPVIYVTHKNIPNCNYKTFKVNEDISDLHKIFNT